MAYPCLNFTYRPLRSKYRTIGTGIHQPRIILRSKPAKHPSTVTIRVSKIAGRNNATAAFPPPIWTANFLQYLVSSGQGEDVRPTDLLSHLPVYSAGHHKFTAWKKVSV